MQHTEGHFRGSGGVELYYQSWLPESEPKAVIVLVHGVGEHCGRYMSVVGPLVDSGCAVYAYDHRGHGNSPGRRVHIDHWAEYREDLAEFLGTVSERVPDRPVVLYGHSMGSLVVLDYLLQHAGGLAGAVISGVAIEPAGVGSPAQIVLARTLTGILPKMSIDLGIDASSLSHDPEAVAAFRTDPLVTGRATVRWGTESLDTVARIKDGMHRIDLPLLILHGGDDPLNRVEGARALYEAAPNADKKLCVYPDTFHEPHNDFVHEQVAADIGRWVAHLTETSA